MALQLDPNSGLPLDPATLQRLQEQDMMRGVAETGGSAADRLTAETVGRGVNTLFPNLAMRQSQQLDAANKANPVVQQPGEGDNAFMIRQLKSQRDNAAAIDPMAAAHYNTQILKFQNAIAEQAHLSAETQGLQDKHQDWVAGSAGRAAEANLAGYNYVAKINPQGELVSTKIFDASDPAQTQSMTDAVKNDPSLRVFSQKQIADLTKSQDSGERKLAQQLLLAQQRQQAGLIPDETVAQMGLDAVINPVLLSRLQPGAKAQLENFYTKAGLSTAEQGAIRAEYKGMMAAVGNATKRQANIDLFANELQNEQKLLLGSMQGLDRGRVALINKAWANGQTYMGDSKGEAAYAAALQTYINTYARVVGGGTGVVSDNARKEALAAISGGYLGPQGMQGATDMLSQKETAIMRGASDATVELYTNPERYRRLTAAQDRIRKLGYNIATTSTDDSATDQRSPPPGPANPQAANAAPKADPLGIR
jgi:hypothetical protein